MFDNNFSRSDCRKGYQGRFTNVVILKKESAGMVQAFPVTDINTIVRRTYSVKSGTEQLHEHKKTSQTVNESPSTIPVKSVSLTKRLNRLLGFFLIAGGILLITKHKKLIR